MRKFTPILFSLLQLFQEELEYFATVECDYVREKKNFIYMYVCIHIYIHM